MEAQAIPLRITAARFWRAVVNLANSPVGGKAKLMAAILVALLCAANALNVFNSYVGRHFMTAIANRNHAEFVRQAIFYVVVFAGLTGVAVLARFAEERLSLLWREDLTRRVLRAYLANNTYYRLQTTGELPSIDQRIAEDVRSFTVTTLSFVLMALNSALTILSFSGVLWEISPLLFAIALAYAALGSFVTIALGRPLVRLNSNQLDLEAAFRSRLLQVRENAEQVMLARQENLHRAKLNDALDRLVENFRRITAINRNVGTFTIGYNWLIQIIPALVIAPAFMNFDVEFGVIGQSAVAFASLVAAFSLIVTQFQSLSSFAAVVARLSAMVEAVERSNAPGDGTVRIEKSGDSIRFEKLTLTAENGEPLISDLSLAMPKGARTLVTGVNAPAAVALFRAAAGVASPGSGLIVLPAPATVAFLAERPYLPRSTLRQALAAQSVPDEEKAAAALEALGIKPLAARAGGWDAEQDWPSVLSLPDQQTLAIARAVVGGAGAIWFDRADHVLGAGRVVELARTLGNLGVTVVSNTAGGATPQDYDAVLECLESGRWTWTPAG